MMSQRGAALEKLGAPRWSWAMHNVLLANKVQQRQVPHLANYSEAPRHRHLQIVHSSHGAVGTGGCLVMVAEGSSACSESPQ